MPDVRVSLERVLRGRSGLLSEVEAWAILSQGVQALQDFFLRGEPLQSNGQPYIIGPETLEIDYLGRVFFREVSLLRPNVDPAERYADEELEKLYISSLGKCIDRALNGEFHQDNKCPVSDRLRQLLEHLAHPSAVSRASLLHVLEVICDYAKQSDASPLSAHVASLHREVSLREEKKKRRSSSSSPAKNFRRKLNMDKENVWKSLMRQPAISVPDMTKLFEPPVVRYPIAETVIEKWRPELVGEPLLEEDEDGVYGKQRTKILEEKPLNKNVAVKRRLSHPVQRTASRLYKVAKNVTGPEFVVRTDGPSKIINLLSNDAAPSKTIAVVLLTGQCLEMHCNPQTVTVKQIFEAVVFHEKIEENFLFGIALVQEGEFVYLPFSTKLHKIAPNGWKDSKICTNFTVYFRLRFYLSNTKSIQFRLTRHLVYLQLRRDLLEGRIKMQKINPTTCSYIALGALALQAEFGNYSSDIHGQGPYFELDHYIPDHIIKLHGKIGTRDLLEALHQKQTGLRIEEAETKFVEEVQHLDTYGYHLYSVEQERLQYKGTEQVYLGIGPRGILVFKNGEQKLFCQWNNLHKITFNKAVFTLQPLGSDGQGKKEKYRYHCCNKAPYVFDLASLHHRFFTQLKARAKFRQLVDSFGVRLSQAVRQFPLSPKTSVPIATTPNWNKQARLLQFAPTDAVNCPSPPHKCTACKYDLPQLPDGFRGTGSLCGRCSISSSLQRRVSKSGSIRMGTKISMATMKREQMRSLESLDVLCEVELTPTEKALSRPFVLDASIKSHDEELSSLSESISNTLAAHWANMSVEEERTIRTVWLNKDNNGSLGIVVMPGCNGGVYLHSVKPGGSAAIEGSLKRGDCIMAVNGRSIDSLSYERALEIVQEAPKVVELKISQICNEKVILSQFLADQSTVV